MEIEFQFIQNVKNLIQLITKINLKNEEILELNHKYCIYPIEKIVSY